MVRSPANLAKITRMVTNGKISRKEAAELLNASVRTIHNYVKRYQRLGEEGLVDHRGGNHRKLDSHIIQQIITCKMQRPSRSARWVRDRLKLNVSVEAVRQVIAKHFANGRPKKRPISRATTQFDCPQLLTTEGTTMIHADSVVKINENIVCQELDGEAVLLNMNTEVYFGLDKTGTHIWSLLREHSTLGSLTGALLEDYDIEEKELQKHLLEFMEKLHAKGLIQIQEG
jgi:transposase